MSPAHRRPARYGRRKVAALVAAVVCVLGAATGWAVVGSRGAPPSASDGATLAAAGPWRTAWALSLAHAGDLTGSDVSCRFVATVGRAGAQVRLRLVNYPATGSVTFSHVTVALRTRDLAVEPSSLRDVTVAGSSEVTLKPGASVITDAVSLPVRTGDTVAVSIAVSSGTSAPWHYWTPQTDACTAPGAGDRTREAGDSAFNERTEDRWLDQVQVLTTTSVPTVAVFGDSLTDGIYLPFDTGARWTDRLQSETGGRVVLLNYGVAGDLLTGATPSGQEPPRLRTDVLAPSGISAVVVQLGSNDIKKGVRAERILAEYAVVARAVAQAGATLVVATVPPRTDGLSAAAERQRQLLNAGLRRYPIVADLDAALRAPGPRGKGVQLRPAYDIGDHIHPNTEGVAALAAEMRRALAKVPGEVGAAVR